MWTGTLAPPKLIVSSIGFFKKCLKAHLLLEAT